MSGTKVPVSPETLIRDAMTILDGCGVKRSPSWVGRTVRDYCSRVAIKGVPFGPWLLNCVELNAQRRREAANDPAIRSHLSYSDPTGERAVRNVMRGRA